MKKIAILLYTNGLEYDDRIRKEVLSICKEVEDVKVKIFALTPDNYFYEGYTEYGIKYELISLKSRRLLPSGRFTFIKAFDLFFTMNRRLKKEYDILWFADPETFLFPLLIRNKPIIWDLHELPSFLYKNRLTKMIFQSIEKNTYKILHANQYRIDFLIKNNTILNPTKHIPVRNFPEEKIQIDISNSDLQQVARFNKWLGESTCVYLQGLSSNARKPIESISAVIESDLLLKAVVVGRFDELEKDFLLKKYGNLFTEKIYFTGQIPQHVTVQYIKQCKLGLVFYELDSYNNRLCEPNRMFQLIMNDCPVIVGCNYPMSEIVNKYHFGITLESDGSSIDEIKRAIELLDKNYKEYSQKIIENKKNILWKQYDSVLGNLIKNIEIR